MVAILYASGLRRAELCGLDLEDFDLNGCVLTVRAGKGRQDRRAFVARGASELVREWINARGAAPGPLFCPVGTASEVRATRLGGESVYYILKKRQREAGVEGITPHDFRRGYVSGLLAAGVDVFTVQKMAGHADAVTTARYDRRGEGVRQRAAMLLELPA
jgi:integrase